MLTFEENEHYEYDHLAADKFPRFCSKFLRHYEGRFAGQPFDLHPIQIQICKDIFGWKDKQTGHRRFSDLWLEGAVGSGKSPLMAAIGIFGLLGMGEAGAQIYSVAATYAQAKTVFDCAKKMIEASPELSRILEVTQYEIRHPKSRSYWRILSGKTTAGMRPSMILADEIHEWKGRELYDSLRGRMTKRPDALCIMATNAGNRQSLYWQLHEEAVATLKGKGNPKLYPIIWAAPEGADMMDPASWRAANPFIGITISEEKIRDEAERAQGEPELEANFRKLFLGQLAGAGTKWLDLECWDRCTAHYDPKELSAAPLYAALDLSEYDDLSAVVYIYATPEKFYARSHFWLPKATAERYDKKSGTTYEKWAEEGHLNLVPESTISLEVKRRIAKQIIDNHKVHKITAVIYDRYRADDVVAACEAAGIVCVPLAQGYSVSPGCKELERRLKESSIIIAPNPVLRAAAEVVETKGDDRGNIWVCKPHAKGTYAGTRAAKIDGIAAFVSGLTEARKATFQETKKQWKGSIKII